MQSPVQHCVYEEVFRIFHNQAKEIDVMLEFIPGREYHMHNQELTYTRDLANLSMSGAYEPPALGYRLGLLVSCNYMK